MVEAHRVDADLHLALDQQFGAMSPMSGPSEANRRISELLAHALHVAVDAIVRERPSGVSLQRATREIVRLARAYLLSPA